MGTMICDIYLDFPHLDAVLYNITVAIRCVLA